MQTINLKAGDRGPFGWLVQCFMMGIMGLMLTACDGNFKAQSSLPAAIFSGAEVIKQLDDNSFELHWKEPTVKAGRLRYQIFIKQLDDVPADGVTIAGVGTRTVTFHELAGDSLPARSGQLVAEVEGNTLSYQVTQALSTDLSFAFQVKAVNEEGIIDDNRSVLVLHRQEKVDYPGCISYESTKDSITLMFEFPVKASKVNIYRDGQVVHSSVSQSETTFTDTGLIAATSYDYICEAVVGEAHWIGSNVLSAQTKNPLSGYVGCLEGRPLGAHDIELSFPMPSEADKITIYRDGNPVYSRSTSDKNADVLSIVGSLTKESIKSIIDRNLQEAVEYTYQCAASIGSMEVIGENELTISTLSSNPPTFAGIREVTALSPRSVRISWGVSSGVQATKFQIFVSPGSSVDWTQPAKIVEAGVLQTEIVGLGDELNYSFGVRACSKQEACDNNKQIKSVTLADGGAPLTAGASATEKENRDFYIIAPWQATDGAIAMRRVYRMTGAVAAMNFADYNDYGTNGLEFPVTNSLAPATRLKVGALQENQTYHFIVRDFDKNGNSNLSSAVVSLSVGDLTPPSWLEGLAALEMPSDASLQESALIARFNGIITETASALFGASHYQIYILEIGATYDASKTACNNATPSLELDANNYTLGANHAYTITGLKARTWYSVCMKARDRSGNISDTTAHRTALVKDRTPPAFSGIQAVTVVNKKVRFLWNPSTASDLYSYHIKFWTDNSSPVPVELPAIVGVSPSLYFHDIEPTNYPQLANGGQVYAIVNACDDFGQKVTGEQNCTSYTLSDYRLLPNLPDLSPPPNFGGIVRVERGASQGQVYVEWSTPVDRTDYAGFSIYNVVDDVIDEFPLEKCICTANNCQSDNKKTCTINLQAGRGYNLTVRAFDRADNLTAFVADQVQPIIYAPDTTDPTWSGNNSFVTATFSQAHTRNELSFRLATDNQYDKSPQAIAYKIYRQSFAGRACPKTIGDIPISGSPFATHTPTSATSDTTTFIDEDLISTTTYLYRIVAVDQQTIDVADNERRQTSDSQYACVETGDTVKPQFVGGSSCPEEDVAGGCPVLNRTNPDDKVWYLSWDMTDPNSGGTDRDDMVVQVWKAATSSSTPPDVGDNLEHLTSNYQREYTGEGALRFPATVGETDSGPDNQNAWVHYLVIVADKVDGVSANKTWASVSVYSENKIEVTKLTRSQGTAAGGKLLAIHGTGFTSTSEVYFDEVDPSTRCTNATLIKIANYDDPKNPIKKLVCTTPAWTLPAGVNFESVNVIIKTNGREVASPNSIKYTFYNHGTGTGYDHICDQTYASNSLNAGGTGTTADPYMMCTINHLKQIASAKTYHLRDNIDLSGVTWTPLADKNNMKFFGNEFFISGMRDVVPIDATSREPWVAFISRLDYGSAIKDLFFVNFELDAGRQLDNVAGGSVYWGRYGAISAYAPGDASSLVTFDNVHVSGNIINNVKPIHAGLVVAYSRYVSFNNVSAYGDIDAGDPARSIVGMAGGITAEGDRGPTVYEKVIYVGTIDANDNAGGIAAVVSNATLNNVKVNADITCETTCGGVVGTIAGPWGGSTSYETAITNTSSTGKLTSHSNGYTNGGIVGAVWSRARLEHLESDMTINGYMWTGGIVGSVSVGTPTDAADRTVTINDVHYSGELTSGGTGGPTHHMGLGGIIGRVFPATALTTLTVSSSTFTGKLNATRHGAGGIIGAVDDSGRALDLTLDTVASTGDITSSHESVGGLIGRMIITSSIADWTGVTIKNSYVGGTITGDTKIGGLIGYAQIKDPYDVKDTYTDAKLVGANHLGGLVGYNQKLDNTVTILGRFNNSYSRATYEFGGVPSLLTKGGLIGYDDGRTSDIVSTFFNSDRAGADVPYAAGNKTTTTTFDRTNTEFANAVNFTGWSSTIWDWDDGYPIITDIRALLAP